MERDSRQQAEKRPVRRFTWLLLLLLAAAALYSGTRPAADYPSPELLPHTRQLPPPTPEPIRASGEMVEVYAAAKPATVRIESRCSNPLYGASPVDVGSGFFIAPDGTLLTAYHVIKRQALAAAAGCGLEYIAVDSSEAVHRLELVAFDAYRDLAMLRSAAVRDSVPYLRLSSRAPVVGSAVVAIGNSRGEFLSDRAGRVTRVGVRSNRPDFASGTIELTAALAPGDSGGPVLARDGTVLGVVSYISFEPGVMAADGDAPLTAWLGASNAPDFAAYAVPVLAESKAMADLNAGVRRDVPVIGFEVAFDYDPRSREAPRLGRRAGVVVGRVQPDGPGAAAGLRSLRQRRTLDSLAQAAGSQLTADVIVAVDGRATPTFGRLLELMRERSVGEDVVLTVQRGERALDITLELAGYREVFR